MSLSFAVTGGSSGIGQQTCLDLAEKHNRLLIIGRDPERTQETKLKCEKISGLNHDVHLIDFLTDDLAKLVDQLPQVDGLAHCAGVTQILPIRNMTMNSIETIMKINLYAPVIFTSLMLKKNKLKEGSSVVFMSSTAAIFPAAGSVTYAMSKAALDAAVMGLTKEYTKKTKIRFNSIRSCYVKTPMLNAIEKVSGVERIKEIEENEMPLGISSPKDVSNLIQFLFSKESSQISGTCLKIDGGKYCSLF